MDLADHACPECSCYPCQCERTMESWLEDVWQWWDHSDPEPEPVQLELPFPPEPGQDKIAGVSHDVAE